jgi:hypothetical protein
VTEQRQHSLIDIVEERARPVCRTALVQDIADEAGVLAVRLSVA